MRRTATVSLGLMLVLAVALSLAPKSAFAAKCNWTAKGRLAVKHQLSELKDKFNGESFLKGVQVNVSARIRVAGVWGPWGSWGTVRTNRKGEFSISKRKSCGVRRFRVRVKFKDSSLKVRHKRSTSSVTKVKWYRVVNNRQHRAGRVSFGRLTFRSRGSQALGNFEARRHADIWILYKMAIRHVRRMGGSYAFTTKVKVKHPHNGIVKDAQEGSYANPTTKVIYIIKNTKKTISPPGRCSTSSAIFGPITTAPGSSA